MTQTREALLAAGVRLYSSLSCELLKGLTANTVAQEAGFHRQTFYRYWGTQGEYVQDLIRWLLQPDATPTADGAVALHERPDVVARPETFARHLAHHDLAALVSDPVTRMQVGLLSMRALDGVGRARLVDDYYEATLAALGVAYEKLLEVWGRRMVAGLDARDLARALQSQLLGVSLLAQAVSDEPPAEAIAERAILAVIEGFTEPVP